MRKKSKKQKLFKDHVCFASKISGIGRIKIVWKLGNRFQISITRSHSFAGRLLCWQCIRFFFGRLHIPILYLSSCLTLCLNLIKDRRGCKSILNVKILHKSYSARRAESFSTDEENFWPVMICVRRPTSDVQKKDPHLYLCFWNKMTFLIIFLIVIASTLSIMLLGLSDCY